MLHKLMAYKDEYEVARLFTNREFRQTLRDRFEGDFTLKFHLPPPQLAKLDTFTYIPRKLTHGPGMEKLSRVIDRATRLTGPYLHDYGYGTVRQTKRHLANKHHSPP